MLSLNNYNFLTDNQRQRNNSQPSCAKLSFDYIHKDGLNEIYRPSTGDFNAMQRSDILAQALRIGVLLDRRDVTEILRTSLLSHQYLNKESDQNGGFFYNKDSRHINSWCTMFGLQALAIFYNNSLISETRNMDLLI